MIAPPRNAIASASFSPLRAASAVRTFARTETFMPIRPQRPDSTAPSRNPNAVGQPSAGITPMITNSTAPTIPIVVYWRLR